MSIIKKVAYLKGLAEGQGIDPETKEGKLMSVIIDILSDMADELEDLDENMLDLAEEIDDLSDDLSDVEEYIFENDDDDDDDFFGFGYEDDEGHHNCEFCGASFIPDAVECPTCGEDIELSDEILSSGSVTCDCGEVIEFEFESADEENDEEPLEEEGDGE